MGAEITHSHTPVGLNVVAAIKLRLHPNVLETGTRDLLDGAEAAHQRRELSKCRCGRRMQMKVVIMLTRRSI